MRHRFPAVFPALAAAMAALSCSQPPPDAQQALDAARAQMIETPR